MAMFRRKSKESQPAVTSKIEKHLAGIVEISHREASAKDSEFKLPFLSGVYTMGYQRAIDAGITELDESFLDSLSKHASAIARDNWRPEFDPATNFHDKIEFAEYNRALKAREDARIGEEHAVSRLREAKQKRDAVKRVGERPNRPTLLLLLCTAMIAVSLSSTVHDRLLPSDMDGQLGLALSIIIGALLAAAPVYGIFHGRNSVKHWIGLAFGILLSAGLFAVRLSGSGSDEVLWAAGWSVVELTGTLLAEFLSRSHYKAELEWEREHHVEVALVAAVTSATEDVSLWRDRMEAAQREIDRVSGIVHERNSRALRIEEFEKLCVNAARDGANAGAAENLGIIRGLKRPSQPVPSVVEPIREAK